MSKKSLKARWADGERVLGTWCAFGCATAVEMSGGIGYDYVCLDLQHTAISEGQLPDMIRAIDLGGSVPIVRAAWNDAAGLMRILDAGAMGVIVPMVNSAEDARAAVAACRYAPTGIRSFGPLRVGLREGPTYFQRANDEIAVLAMIETAEAAAALDEILEVPGLDGLYIGIFDLSVSLGLPPGNNDGTPEFDAVINGVLEGCRRKGIVAACHSSADAAAMRIEQGFQMVTVTADFLAMRGALIEHLADARAALERTE